MKIIPKRDQVLIRIDAPEDMTPGGIILPADAQKKRETAEVVAVGPGLAQMGKVLPLDLEAGERVIFNSWNPAEVECAGETLHLIDFNAVLAVIE